MAISVDSAAARFKGAPELRTRRSASGAGYTLVELSVVLVIIGVLVLVGAPYYKEGRVGAKRNACIAHQRMIYEAALIYCSDNVLANGNINVSAFLPILLQTEAGDCPSDEDGSQDDYTIVIEDGRPLDVICDIMGDEHPWSPLAN